MRQSVKAFKLRQQQQNHLATVALSRAGGAQSATQRAQEGTTSVAPELQGLDSSGLWLLAQLRQQDTVRSQAVLSTMHFEVVRSSLNAQDKEVPRQMPALTLQASAVLVQHADPLQETLVPLAPSASDPMMQKSSDLYELLRQDPDYNKHPSASCELTMTRDNRGGKSERLRSASLLETDEQPTVGFNQSHEHA